MTHKEPTSTAVQEVDNAIHRMNLYSVDSARQCLNNWGPQIGAVKKLLNMRSPRSNLNLEVLISEQSAS